MIWQAQINDASEMLGVIFDCLHHEGMLHCYVSHFLLTLTLYLLFMHRIYLYIILFYP